MVEATVDLGNVDVMLQQAASAVGDIAGGMLEAADAAIMPAVYDASVTVWYVRTGNYSNGWWVSATGPTSIQVGNDVEYAAPLEYGWTDRGGGAQPSPGVLGPAVYDSMEGFQGELASWLMTQLGT
jgi:hypothetical protein